MAGYSRLRRTSDQRKALLRDLVTDLIIHGQIETTEAKAKELRKFADRMVTLGKKGTLAARRQAAAFVRAEDVKKVKQHFKSFLVNLLQNTKIETVATLAF